MKVSKLSSLAAVARCVLTVGTVVVCFFFHLVKSRWPEARGIAGVETFLTRYHRAVVAPMAYATERHQAYMSWLFRCSKFDLSL